MEKTVKGRDAIIARHEEEKARLAARILDLERQCSELAGRRMEREEAYEELQTKAGGSPRAGRATQGRERHSPQGNRASYEKAVDRQRHIESLERGIERRDESVAALTAEVEQGKAVVSASSPPPGPSSTSASTSSRRARRALATNAEGYARTCA